LKLLITFVFLVLCVSIQAQEPLPSPLPAPTIPPPDLEHGVASRAFPGDRLPIPNGVFVVPPQMIVVINTEGRQTDCLGPRFREVGGRQELDEPYKWNEVLKSIEVNQGFPASICTVKVPEFGYWSFHRCKLDCVEERERFR
jgi:hypothetical protein